MVRNYSTFHYSWGTPIAGKMLALQNFHYLQRSDRPGNLFCWIKNHVYRQATPSNINNITKILRRWRKIFLPAVSPGAPQNEKNENVCVFFLLWKLSNNSETRILIFHPFEQILNFENLSQKLSADSWSNLFCEEARENLLTHHYYSFCWVSLCSTQPTII